MISLTVVVPTHGRTALFLETLTSLAHQSLESFEVVVTDDSTDPDDREVIAAATRDYTRTTGRPASYVFTRPGLGQAANTNQGLRRAQGTILRILHSDDILARRALETEVALLNDPRVNLDLLFHGVEPFRTRPSFDRLPRVDLVQPSLLFRTTMHSGTPLPSATVFRRSAMEAVGLMREDLHFLCDWEFMARLVREQVRRHRFIGMLSRGLIGWRVHGDSTTGRLWHRHFLEHEQFMRELSCDQGLLEDILSDSRGRDEFFAIAVRYRYRRLGHDIAGMAPWQALRSSPMIVRCALSPASVRERVRPAPWSPLGSRRYPSFAVDDQAAPPLPAEAYRSQFVEPRRGLRFVLSAYFSAAVIRWAKAHAAATPAAEATLASPIGGDLDDVVGPSDHLEVRHSLSGPPPGADTTRVITEFNNSMNLAPLRGLLASATRLSISTINTNHFADLVLHQCLKLLPPGAEVTTQIHDNRHLASFGLKSLIDHQFPGQFTWSDQRQAASRVTLLRYRRSMPGHGTFSDRHTGWTFGMLTTGVRIPNVERFIASIEEACDEPYEILLVSPVDLGEVAQRPHVRVLRFSEHDDLGWITRKKNLICAEAVHSDILVCHDRFWLRDDFVRSFRDWGFAYGLAAPRVRLADGRRGLDWAVVSSQNRVWSTGGLLDYRAHSQYAYNPGGATVIRKAFWKDFPWNENLFWNEHEDVELCRRIQRAGGHVALAASTLIAAEDRWVNQNPPIPYWDQNDVLYGGPVGEQRAFFLPRPAPPSGP